jgi:hypothetical protein
MGPCAGLDALKKNLALPGVEPGEADHSPSSNAEGQEWWSYTSTPPYAFMA